MNLKNYTDDQLRAIVSQVIFKHVDEWPTSGRVAVHHSARKSRVYEYVYIPPYKAKETGLYVLFHSGGTVDTRIERNISEKLADLRPDLEPHVIANVRRRRYWSRALLLQVCRGIQKLNSKKFKQYLDNFDVDAYLRRAHKQKRRTQHYLQRRRAKTFTLRDQTYIAKKVFQLILNQAETNLAQELLKDSSKLDFKITFNTSDGGGDNDFVKLASGRMWADEVDETGQRLYNSIADTFKIDVQNILDYLALDGKEVSRRFVASFSEKHRASAMIDSNPLVRIVASEKSKEED